MSFKIGDKIMCIDNTDIKWGYPQLALNSQYTVEDTGIDCNGLPWVEISRFGTRVNGLYAVKRFKPFEFTLKEVTKNNVVMVDFVNKKWR